MTRYRWVDSQKADHDVPVAAACDAAGVSRSAYYAWAAARRSRRSLRERAEARLVSAIRRIHTDSDGTYGSPRVTRQLRHDGHVVNRKRVERLMRLHGIVGHRPRRRRSLTRQDTTAAPAPDLLGRLFDLEVVPVQRIRRRGGPDHFVFRALGHVGDLSTAERLRVHTLDPDAGATAVDAIRRINERHHT